MLLVAGCGSTDTGPLAWLRAMEEASLAYPGSIQLGELALKQQTGSVNRPQSVIVGYAYATGSAG